jgi:translocator protein
LPHAAGTAALLCRLAPCPQRGQRHVRRMTDQTVPMPFEAPNQVAATRSLRLPIIIATIAAIATAGIGGALTDIGPWYQALQFPDWKPVDAVFPIMWTTIFALCAIAGVLHWRAAQTPSDRKLIIGLWAFNAAMNIAWSALFFAMQRPDFGLYQVPTLWLSIVSLVVLGWRFSKVASVMLLPYLGWVSVAAALNFEIVRLNGL